jgi:hypothetical protein
MSKRQGTPSGWTLGQFTRVASAILTALPKALAGVNPRYVLAFIGKRGEFIEQEMAKMFISLIGPGSDSAVLTSAFKHFMGPRQFETDAIERRFVYRNNPGLPRIVVLPNFEAQIYREVGETIPAMQGKFHVADANPWHISQESLARLGTKFAWTPNELFGIIRHLLTFDRGHAGYLHTNGGANVFHVRVGSGEIRTVTLVFVNKVEGSSWHIDSPKGEISIWPTSPRIIYPDRGA